MAISPELKRMVSGAGFDPLEAKRAEILARLEVAEREVGEHEPSIGEQLVWLGLQKATKRELREIVLKAMERDLDA